MDAETQDSKPFFWEGRRTTGRFEADISGLRGWQCCGFPAVQCWSALPERWRTAWGALLPGMYRAGRESIYQSPGKKKEIIMTRPNKKMLFITAPVSPTCYFTVLQNNGIYHGHPSSVMRKGPRLNEEMKSEYPKSTRT